ncbi:MAG: hypothetical protein N0C84_19190 [Candidatus Thiodiazotropha taylori]|nr:hypothetical protein [Candidatus Thiodiazotropha taylori]MCW4318426.1 hypothetical protein [Candidatus Thiodiazotropha taylori]MCW4323741.1 hypothetical protein [Candidatus Thiodiazotropha taylori]
MRKIVRFGLGLYQANQAALFNAPLAQLEMRQDPPVKAESVPC